MSEEKSEIKEIKRCFKERGISEVLREEKKRERGRERNGTILDNP